MRSRDIQNHVMNYQIREANLAHPTRVNIHKANTWCRYKKNLIYIQQPDLISLQGDHNTQGKCHTISIPNLIGVSETSSNNKAQDHQDPVDFRNVDSAWDLVWSVDNLHSWKATQGYRLLYYRECGRYNCLTCSNSCHCCKCKHWPIESIWRKCQKQDNTLGATV